jgi:biotin carboxyl carrier protein
VLEAMKMENTITATYNAKIKSIAVTKGQSVAKNELLIELE